MSVGLAWLRADDWAGRCQTGFKVRQDLAAGLSRVFDEVRARGGIITSSGGLRYLDASLNVARSPMSLHYLGRAIDLCVHSGMQTPKDPYVVLEDGVEGDLPVWRLMCVTRDGSGDARSLDARIWRRDVGSVGQPRTGSFVDLTGIFAAHSWRRIAARPAWKTVYTAVEWWHFECHDGLEPSTSTFGEELMQLYPLQVIEDTPLASYLDHVWDGCRFALPA